MSTLTVCILYGIAVAAIVLLAGGKPAKNRLGGNDGWLFDNIFEKLYGVFFGDADAVGISKAFGLEYDRYMVDCAVIGKTPNLKKECMMRVIGTVAFAVGVVLTVILRSVFPMLIGIAAFAALASVVPRSAHSSAERKKQRMITEMPRFVDLFLSALEINLPIEQAIQETAENVPCLLSEELKAAFAATKLGAKNWQQALEAIARKYEIDQLSDFTLNVITAYNKGVSVTDAVARESYAIRQTALLTAKEKTAKMSSQILFPLLVFKILPLLVLLMVPIMLQAFAFYGS